MIVDKLKPIHRDSTLPARVRLASQILPIVIARSSESDDIASSIERNAKRSLLYADALIDVHNSQMKLKKKVEEAINEAEKES